MGFKDGAKLPESSKTLPFPVENQQPPLSIPIDDVDMGFFYREYYSMVFNRCLDMLRNKEDAQDAAHDVFAKVQELKSKGRLKIQYPKTYLSVAGRNMGINKKKARKEIIAIYDMATDESLDTLKYKMEQDQEKAEAIVQDILDEQDETTRKIYFYRFRDNMTLEQIGEAVGLKKSAVQKKIKKLEKQARVKTGRAGT